MYRILAFLLFTGNAFGQLAPLTVEKIMRDPKWIGISPSNAHWVDQTVYFSWNPENNKGDSLYAFTSGDAHPHKVTPADRKLLPGYESVFNRAHTKRIFVNNGDLFLTDIKSHKTTQITKTVMVESSAVFSNDEKKIVFVAESNLFSWDISTGTIQQHSNFKEGEKEPDKKPTSQERWLKADQLATFDVLKKRSDNRNLADKNRKANRPKLPKEIFLADRTIESISLSTDENFLAYQLRKNSNPKSTIVPSYVTESGFTTDLQSSPKVGAPKAMSELFVYEVSKDTVYQVKTDSLPGIYDQPGYKKEYAKPIEEKNKKLLARPVSFSSIVPSSNGQNQLILVSTLDFKDRWICLLNFKNHALTPLDRQHDDAWLSWISSFDGFGWVDDHTIWYISEESGFAHLYVTDIHSKMKKALTSGKYEVQEVQLSRDKKFFYLSTNEVHPGEKQFYKLPVTGGKAEQITTIKGSNDVAISDDEKWIAVRYSYSNKPWELFIQENKSGAIAKQITSSLTDEFKSYPWRDPEITTFKARDGAEVAARLFKPTAPNGAAVIFVHGAGYLQNAHRWWSSYFREYMFHNLLVDKGYTVLDIDYRGSAGYGRDWRTGIYRHMGGKDLTDNLDGAQWLVSNFHIDPKRIGVYGGSYGGFITLMAMFTSPETFASGAALRPVTDWAHYNSGYTGSILNEPVDDSLSYARSSPIYYAKGLKGHLLICHGMIDTNVHFQDAVRLSQKLIELGKDNWELAVYPLENHGFVEPSSWTDEYKRILKLFDQTLIAR